MSTTKTVKIKVEERRITDPLEYPCAKCCFNVGICECPEFCDEHEKYYVIKKIGGKSE